MMNSELTKISRFLSLILRHKPEVIGVELDEHGWADVHKLIGGVRNTYSDFNEDVLIEIVQTDEKQRYSFNNDGTKIRANQGHSVKVDVELKRVAPPDYLYHGTAVKYEKSIDENGLLPKSRLYVHLSSDLATAITVGMRHGDVVIYEVESGRMAADGYDFYLSENGVWLTKIVPVGYLKKGVVKPLD